MAAGQLYISHSSLLRECHVLKLPVRGKMGNFGQTESMGSGVACFFGYFVPQLTINPLFFEFGLKVEDCCRKIKKCRLNSKEGVTQHLFALVLCWKSRTLEKG